MSKKKKPGNELEVTKFLVNGVGKISLRHVGLVNKVGAPKDSGVISLKSIKDISLVSSEDAYKKADIYINDKGISIKQTGGSNMFNRLQRANLKEVYENVKLENIDKMLQKIDGEVRDFHKGKLERRNRPWQDFFSKEDFKVLLKYLMMRGSPNKGDSVHPAHYILEAPAICESEKDLSIYTFDEYFEKYADKLVIAIRRQWIGQASKSEHSRATGLAKKPGNAPWVFNGVVGKPKKGWGKECLEPERKTVYFLMIEKLS